MITCNAIDPVDAPTIQYDNDPATPDQVAPMCDGDPDDLASEIPVDHVLVVPALEIPDDVPSMVPVPVIPGDVHPWSGS